MDIIKKLAQELTIKEEQAKAAVQLIDEGNTIPFIARYRKEDIENIRLVYHLVKEKGLTLQGAKQKLKVSKDTSIRATEILDRLLLVREELASMRKELDYLT